MDENPYKSPESVVAERPVDAEKAKREDKPPSFSASVVFLLGGMFVIAFSATCLSVFLRHFVLTVFADIGLMETIFVIGAIALCGFFLSAGVMSLREAFKGFRTIIFSASSVLEHHVACVKGEEPQVD